MKSSGACHVLGSHATRLAVLCLVTFAVLPSLNRPQTPAEAPLFEIQEGSSVKFDVKASVPIAGTFDKRNAAASSRSTTAASIRSSTAQPISKPYLAASQTRAAFTYCRTPLSSALSFATPKARASAPSTKDAACRRDRRTRGRKSEPDGRRNSHR